METGASVPCELTPGVSSPHGLLENAAMKPLANARPGKAGPLLGEAALAPGGSGGGGHSQHPGLPKGSTAGREGGRPRAWEEDPATEEELLPEWDHVQSLSPRLPWSSDCPSSPEYNIGSGPPCFHPNKIQSAAKSHPNLPPENSVGHGPPSSA